MLSRQPSRNSTRFPNLGQRRSWESSWKLDFRSSFDLGRYRPGCHCHLLNGIGKRKLIRLKAHPPLSVTNLLIFKLKRSVSCANKRKTLIPRLLIEGPARERGVRTEPFMEDELVLITPPSFGILSPEPTRLSPFGQRSFQWEQGHPVRQPLQQSQVRKIRRPPAPWFGREQPRAYTCFHPSSWRV